MKHTDPHGGRRDKRKGQNKSRHFGYSKDGRGLCSTRVLCPEFSPKECPFGDKCRYEHDLRAYLSQYKRQDLSTLEGRCPAWQARGWCNSGWRCRFVGSHSTEKETPDGRKELLLVVDQSREQPKGDQYEDSDVGLVNCLDTATKLKLSKKQFQTPKSDAFMRWVDEASKVRDHGDKQPAVKDEESSEAREDHRARFREPPPLPSEKRRLYYGPETPVLAPLTTQGNLPFRRLCVELGAQLTFSEMAMGLPLIQGQKAEWALIRAHESETKPPRISIERAQVLQGYDNGKDLKFGAQIAGNKEWLCTKATEVVTQLCPHLRVVDLNCGCPIDLVYKQGAGSALLDSRPKLGRILRGMNTVSGEVPVSVKIRMGTRDNSPTALKLIDRLVYGITGGSEPADAPSGVAAVTLHGRSRQQRYAKSADWEYIAECASLIQRHRQKGDDLADTVREADERYLAAGASSVRFLGNGDCYSHVDYYDHLERADVDTVMIARGALIKPWIFEEIEKGQHLDKSASERLSLVEKFVKYGMDVWGSDELGIGLTRRFLLEWLSFAHRYVPVGILEHLPPSLQDRPPAWRGRNDLETLLASENYRDWIKIRYVNLSS